MKKLLIITLLAVFVLSGVGFAAQETLYEETEDLGGAFGNDFKLTVFANWAAQARMNSELYGKVIASAACVSDDLVVTFTDATTVTATDACKDEIGSGTVTIVQTVDPTGTGETTSVPSEVAVGDALALKQNALTDPIVAAGAQSITGVKTYTASPIVPTPTTDMQSATKKYVDDGLDLKPNIADQVDAGTVGANLIVADTAAAAQQAMDVEVGVDIPALSCFADTTAFEACFSSVVLGGDAISSVLTGYVASAGTVAATDTILEAIEKLGGNDALGATIETTIVDTDPTIASASGVYASTATGDGNSNVFFVVDQNESILSMAGTFTAADRTPSGFTGVFNADTDVALSTLTTAGETYTVAGVDAGTAISITGGNYQIGSEGWKATADTVDNGDVVGIQQTSSDTNSTETIASLTIGTETVDYSVTTVDAVSVGCSATPFYTEDTADASTYLLSSSAATILMGGSWRSTTPTVPICKIEVYAQENGDVSALNYQAEIWTGGDGATNLGSIAQTSASVSGSTVPPNGSPDWWGGFEFESPGVSLSQTDSIMFARTDHTESNTNNVSLTSDYNGDNTFGYTYSAADGATSLNINDRTSLNVKLYGFSN